MKTVRLLAIALVVFVSALAHGAENQSISQQDQNNVRQMTQAMKAIGIPEAQSEKMLTLMYRNRFQQQNIVRAQKVVIHAAKEGLPTEPIMNKAMEGMVKQAPEQQVVKAMEAVRSRHENAYRIARSLTNDKKSVEILAGSIADSLAAGMSVQEMNRIEAQLTIETRQRDKTQAEKLSLQTMQTVCTMARLGAKSTDVADTVGLALQHKYTSQQMQQMRHAFTRDTNQNSAQQLARQYAGSIKNGDNPGQSGGGGSSNGGGNASGSDGSGGGSSDGGGNAGGADGSGGGSNDGGGGNGEGADGSGGGSSDGGGGNDGGSGGSGGGSGGGGNGGGGGSK